MIRAAQGDSSTESSGLLTRSLLKPWERHGQLDESAKGQVRSERRAAKRLLRAALAQPAFDAALLGLPAPHEALALFATLETALLG